MANNKSRANIWSIHDKATADISDKWCGGYVVDKFNSSAISRRAITTYPPESYATTEWQSTCRTASG
jgi:hypothetical protein